MDVVDLVYPRLVSGTPQWCTEKSFKCKLGVQQSDPLSPLLFVLATELLQLLVNKASKRNLLKAPIPQATGDFPIV
jgi:hypothetical protein